MLDGRRSAGGLVERREGVWFGRAMVGEEDVDRCGAVNLVRGLNRRMAFCAGRAGACLRSWRILPR